jgi:hypothetical protein
MDSLQVLGECLDSSCITPSFGRTLSVRLVIIGTIVVIVPFFALLLLKMFALLAPVFNPAVCISVVDDVMQITIILIPHSAAFLQWGDTAG